MKRADREDFAKRQAQWDAFHKWESERSRQPISIEERLSWYVAAFKLTHNTLNRADFNDIEAKTEFIQTLRGRLAHLK